MLAFVLGSVLSGGPKVILTFDIGAIAWVLRIYFRRLYNIHYKDYLTI